MKILIQLVLFTIFLAGCVGGSGGGGGGSSAPADVGVNNSLNEDFQGTLLLPDGRPAQGAEVFFLGAPEEVVIADKDGNFSISLPSSLIQESRASGVKVTHLAKNVSIVATTTDNGNHYGWLKKDVVVDESNSVGNKLGKVYMSLTGNIAVNVILAGQDDHLGIDVFIPGTSFIGKTDSNGNVLISNVPEGDWDLVALHDGYIRSEFQNVHVDSDETTSLDGIVLIADLGIDGTMVLNNGLATSNSRVVPISLTYTSGATLYKIADEPSFTNTYWRAIESNSSWTFTDVGEKTLYVLFSNANGLQSSPLSRDITIDLFSDSPEITVNNSLVTTSSVDVNLSYPQNTYQIMLDTNDDFSSGVWQEPSPIISYQIPANNSIGSQSIYFKVRDDSEYESPVSATTISIPPKNVDVGLQAVCIISIGKKGYCWGQNAFGELGNGSFLNDGTGVPTPQEVKNLSNITKISVGNSSTCAITSDKKLHCWGSNYYGQLANSTNIGTHNPNTLPVEIEELGSTVIGVTIGQAHICVLKESGKVFCWGRNYVGQTGNSTNIGTTNSNPVPTEVIGVSDVDNVFAGIESTCTLSNGATKCWGKIGSNTTTSPTAITGLETNVIKISTRGDYHTCALKSDGSVKCWGSNEYGQIGNGNTTTPQNSIQSVSLGKKAIDISTGMIHSCAVLEDGSIKCWGHHQEGYLGLGDEVTSPQSSPQSVNIGNNKATAISSGYNTCILTESGKTFCWGPNGRGQVGNGLIGNPDTFPSETSNGDFYTTPQEVIF